MVFSSPVFLFLFLPIVLGIYFILPRFMRNCWLLVMSLLFYTWGEHLFTLVMLASIAMNYLSGLLIDRFRGGRGANHVLWASVAANLVLLICYKYSDFLLANLNVLLIAAHWQPLHEKPTHLPIGISFFTFHAISYVIDVHRGNARVQKNFLNFALYESLFPQLVAGPIIRYQDIADQIDRRRETLSGFAYGVIRFITGLSKKMLIANVLAVSADEIFALPSGGLSTSVAWLGAICYALQIYFDFSGYSDMAVGLGHMFGFRFVENFNYPYVSRSIQEFWRRWHISLSTWFRDYLYIPLGGNRVSPRRIYLNLIIVFFLCGLWHGASWNFVIWGNGMAGMRMGAPPALLRAADHSGGMGFLPVD
jgi:alginate O-acetyltransferase complex protein AlgI